MAELYVGRSRIKGRGCFTRNAISKGELVAEYTGERISSEEADRRHGDAEIFYIFMLEDGTCIDPTNDPNPIKFANHCCDPNIESEEDDDQIFFYALRDIEADEELFFDYCVEADEDEDLTCLCGAANCRSTMRDQKKQA